jgi:hypothetical protein
MALLLAGGGVSSLVAATAQQLSGQLLIGPTCAGPEREGQACPSAPWADTKVQLRGEGGAVVGQTLSDGQGRFSIAAPAGRYRLVVLVPKVTRCPSPEVDLPMRSADPLVLDCDSGRR